MFIAFCGLIAIVSGALGSYEPLVKIGFGAIFVDIVIELANLKNQLWAVGKALRDELRKEKKEDA